MDEIVFMQNTENAGHFEEFNGSRVPSVTTNGRTYEAHKRDTTFLARKKGKILCLI